MPSVDMLEDLEIDIDEISIPYLRKIEIDSQV